MDTIEFDPLFRSVFFLIYEVISEIISVQKTVIIGVGCGYFFVFGSGSPGPHYSFRWSNVTSLFIEKAFIFWGSQIIEHLLLVTFLAPGRPDVFQEFRFFFSADGAGPIISYYFRMSSITKSLLFYDWGICVFSNNAKPHEHNFILVGPPTEKNRRIEPRCLFCALSASPWILALIYNICMCFFYKFFNI